MRKSRPGLRRPRRRPRRQGRMPQGLCAGGRRAMLYTVKSPGRRAFTTDCPREAFDELMRRRKATVIVGRGCLAEEVDLESVLRRRPEDGRHARQNQYVRFEFMCRLAFELAVCRVGEEKPYLDSFDALDPARKAAIALSEGHAMDFLLETIAPPDGAGDEVCSGSVLNALPKWTSEVWQRAWGWLSERADRDEALGKLITGFLSGREPLDSVREYFRRAGEAQTTDR